MIIDHNKTEKKLFFGRCVSCGRSLDAPPVKFPTAIKKGATYGNYSVEYMSVCQRCVKQWSDVYIEKTKEGDFIPEERWKEHEREIQDQTESMFHYP